MTRERRRLAARFFLIGLGVVAPPGCQSRPDDLTAATKEALAAAKELDAETFSAELYREAEKDFRASEAELAAQSGRTLPFLRNYQEARKRLTSANEKAQVAALTAGKEATVAALAQARSALMTAQQEGAQELAAELHKSADETLRAAEAGLAVEGQDTANVIARYRTARRTIEEAQQKAKAALEAARQRKPLWVVGARVEHRVKGFLGDLAVSVDGPLIVVTTTVNTQDGVVDLSSVRIERHGSERTDAGLSVVGIECNDGKRLYQFIPEPSAKGTTLEMGTVAVSSEGYWYQNAVKVGCSDGSSAVTLRKPSASAPLSAACTMSGRLLVGSLVSKRRKGDQWQLRAANTLTRLDVDSP